MYNIDWIRLLLFHIPELLGLPIILGLAKAFITPIQLIYNDFITRRNRDIYKLGHNSQVCYMEAALNDSFDTTLRRIHIEDSDLFPRIYIYTTAELKPKYIYTHAEGKPLYLYTRNEYSDTAVDFNVYVPADLESSINIYALRALIDYYKLASKRYQIIYE
jgi:hypothetical protein